MGTHRESPLKRVNPSGKVVWVARYTGPDGKRRSAGTFKLQRVAQRAIDAAYSERENHPVMRDTVGAYAKDWTQRYPRSERTNKTNDGRIAQVLDVEIEKRKLRDWPLAELRRRHALELADHMLREHGRAATGVTNILRTLSAVAEDAITDEIIGVNPFKGTKVRKNDTRAQKKAKEGAGADVGGDAPVRGLGWRARADDPDAGRLWPAHRRAVRAPARAARPKSGHVHRRGQRVGGPDRRVVRRKAA